jgi:hypothetical protein
MGDGLRCRRLRFNQCRFDLYPFRGFLRTGLADTTTLHTFTFLRFTAMLVPTFVFRLWVRHHPERYSPSTLRPLGGYSIVAETAHLATRAFAYQNSSCSGSTRSWFLRLALRETTRTRFSFQGTASIFSHRKEKPEVRGLKPGHLTTGVGDPVACGRLKPILVNEIII